MRIGINPYKLAEHGENKAYISKDVLVAVLTFIPNFEGYYKERFDLLKLSLSSLIKNTSKETADILVFDNGSCDKVIQYLQALKDKGDITFLIQSHYNLGYNGALNFIYATCQANYLAYADDDVFYHENWLTESIKIHEAFPEVGMVCGCPSKSKFGENNKAFYQLASIQETIIEENESLWDKKWDQLFYSSIGNTVNDEEFEKIKIPMLKRGGISCWATSTHFQYVIKRKAIELLYPFPVGDLMSSNHKNPNFNMKIVFDKKLDDHGMAKVTTAQLKTEHLGNVWSPRASELASELLIENRIHRISTDFEFGWKYKLIFKILNVSFVNKIARALYDKLFYVFGMKTLYDRLNKK